MSLGAILVGLGLLLLSVFAITEPWRRPPGPAQAPKTPVAASVLQAAPPALEAQRDAAYAALADLDFDHSLGKLNEEDYRTVRARLLAQAVAALRELDATAADIESQVEALVRSRRAALQTNGRVQNVQRSAAPRSNNQNAPVTLYCVGCGAVLGPDDHFCGKCGTPVDARCPRCGAAVQADDHFCARCGAPLAVGAAA
jgi:rRNA maturation endonuclease Nob1